MKYYTIYKITNKLDGKIYIGKHETEDLNDSYMGSGTYLKNAIHKHGIENFEKEILYVFITREEMNGKEAELVNESFIERKDTYNLAVGGVGSWKFVIDNKLNNLANQCYIAAQKIKDDDEFRKWFSNRVVEGLKKIQFQHGTFKGRKHSEETKQRMRESHKGKHEGERNSQYGKVWIHNLEEKRSTRVPKEQLDEWLDKGWIRGRKMKFCGEIK